MRFSQVIVFGAGAIGSTIGALLSEKFPVLLVARKEHVDAANRKCLKLSGKIRGKFSVKAVSKLKKIPENSLVLLTMKTYHLENALKQLKPLVKKSATIACLQNGLGSREIVGKGLNHMIVEGFTYVSAELVKPGHVNVSGSGKTFFDSSKGGKAVAKALSECGMDAVATEKFREEQWKKLCHNCVSNPLSAILGMESKKICRPEIEPLMKGLFEECRKVAEKQGIIVEENLFRDIYSKLCVSGHRPSMLQDIGLGNKTEIDFLNGKIVALGKQLGIATPYNKTITAVVKFMERKNNQ